MHLGLWGKADQCYKCEHGSTPGKTCCGFRFTLPRLRHSDLSRNSFKAFPTTKTRVTAFVTVSYTENSPFVRAFPPLEDKKSPQKALISDFLGAGPFPGSTPSATSDRGPEIGRRLRLGGTRTLTGAQGRAEHVQLPGGTPALPLSSAGGPRKGLEEFLPGPGRARRTAELTA